MFDRFDHLELLDFVEGDLSAREHAALQGRLASDPVARAALAAMIRQRGLLRTMPEPALPADFLVEIEPLLARPMLIEPIADAGVVPGEFRRRHRRRRFVVHPMRLTAAAIIMFAVLGSAIALLMNLSQARHDDGDQAQAAHVQGQERVRGVDISARQPEAARGSFVEPTTVHHARPMVEGDAVSSDGSDLSEPASVVAATDPVFVAAEFAVVVSPIALAAQAMPVELSISSAALALGEHAAIVRNFSFEEAQRLAEKHQLARGAGWGSRQPTIIAHAPGMHEAHDGLMTRDELHELARDVREHLRHVPASGPDGDLISDASVLAGAAKLAPTLEQQLEFSSQGASHTLAVHAAALPQLLERLGLDPHQSTMLRMLPTTSAAAGAEKGVSPTLVWLNEGPLVRQAIARLSKARGDTVVLVPVIVR